MESKTLPRSIDPDFLFELLTSRISSYIFEISLDLGLFHYLKGGQKNIASISKFCNLPISSTRIVLQYLCSLGLVIFRHGVFGNAEAANRYLTDEYIVQDLRRYKIEGHISDFKKKLASPDRQPWYQMKGSSINISEASGLSESFFVSDDVHEWRIRKGEELASLYDFKPHSHLLDIGGASGGWSIGIMKSNRHLICNLFDLPEVCSLAEGLLHEYIDAEMFRVTPGDFFEDEFPKNADVMLFANVLHDWSEVEGKGILKNAYNALPSGGVVLVSEYFVDDEWRGPLTSVYHGITVLGRENESGWQPSYAEMERMLEQSGFGEVRRLENLLVATK
jgi:hypothetical protein